MPFNWLSVNIKFQSCLDYSKESQKKRSFSRNTKNCWRSLTNYQHLTQEEATTMKERTKIKVQAIFEKAYEKVKHLKLMEKMKTKYNITGKLGKWLQIAPNSSK